MRKRHKREDTVFHGCDYEMLMPHLRGHLRGGFRREPLPREFRGPWEHWISPNAESPVDVIEQVVYYLLLRKRAGRAAP